MTVAQQLRQEGRQAGRHEGIVLGMEKGMARGMERGMERRTLDIARNMLIKNTDPDFIRDITGLSIHQIKSLRTHKTQIV